MELHDQNIEELVEILRVLERGASVAEDGFVDELGTGEDIGQEWMETLKEFVESSLSLDSGVFYEILRSLETPSSARRVGTNESAAGTRSAAADSGKRRHNQGTLRRGHQDRESGPHVPESALQEIFHQYESHDHSKEDDGEVLPEVPERQAGAASRS